MRTIERKDAADRSFGSLLREFRLAAGLSQELLAEHAHMSSGGISMLERGARRAPRRDTVAVLADALSLCTADRERLQAAAHQPPQPRRRVNAAPVHNLPRETSSFVDRTTETAEIAEFLQSRTLVTVVGTGGVGKTRTAVHVAYAYGSSSNMTVWFVDFSPVRSSSSAASVIAETIGLQERANGLTTEHLVSYFSKKPALLVLDNCEHLLPDIANVVRDINEACDTVRILATSREPLKVEGEGVYRLPSLAEDQAVELFAQRAGAVDHRFRLTGDNRSLVAHICQRLDGIPLAIELAAARVGVLPLKALNDKLDERFSMLARGDQSGSPRQRTMRTLIDWSYDLLSVQEQHLFEELSVFAGGCTLEAVTRVCGGEARDESEILDLLASLVEKSLLIVTLENEIPRYVLLESMRAYAHEKLMERGDWGRTADRHATAYYEIASRLAEIGDRRFPQNIATEVQNWRAALDWTLNGDGDPQLGICLTAALRPIWMRIAPSEGRAWVAAAFTHVNERTPLLHLASLEGCAANIALRFNETSRTHDLAKLSLEHAQAIDDARGIAEAQRLMGYTQIVLGRVDLAEALLHAALESSRRNGFRWLEAATLKSLGVAYSFGGSFERAQRAFSESIAIYREVGEMGDVAVTALNLAEAMFKGGDPQGAVKIAEQALEGLGTLGLFRAHLLTNLSVYFIVLSRYDEARSCLAEAIDLAFEQGLTSVVTWCVQHLAAVAVLRPAWERSTDSFSDTARLLGFVDSQLSSLDCRREYSEQQEYDSVIAAVRENLDPETIRALNAAGSTMIQEQAIELALSL
jgi:predicted ATPase/tetratricopeptide (TPR) repeat protein/DNA-binding XRE family transcriptional regulator